MHPYVKEEEALESDGAPFPESGAQTDLGELVEDAIVEWTQTESTGETGAIVRLRFESPPNLLS
jgi:hypothetical protein